MSYCRPKHASRPATSTEGAMETEQGPQSPEETVSVLEAQDLVINTSDEDDGKLVTSHACV